MALMRPPLRGRARAARAAAARGPTSSTGRAAPSPRARARAASPREMCVRRVTRWAGARRTARPSRSARESRARPAATDGPKSRSRSVSIRIATPSAIEKSTSATASARRVEPQDALGLLRGEQRRDVVARAAQELGELGAISSLRRDSVNSSKMSVMNAGSSTTISFSDQTSPSITSSALRRRRAARRSAPCAGRSRGGRPRRAVAPSCRSSSAAARARPGLARDVVERRRATPRRATLVRIASTMRAALSPSMDRCPVAASTRSRLARRASRCGQPVTRDPNGSSLPCSCRSVRACPPPARDPPPLSPSRAALRRPTLAREAGPRARAHAPRPDASGPPARAPPPHDRDRPRRARPGAARVRPGPRLPLGHMLFDIGPVIMLARWPSPSADPAALAHGRRLHRPRHLLGRCSSTSGAARSRRTSTSSS